MTDRLAEVARPATQWCCYCGSRVEPEQPHCLVCGNDLAEVGVTDDPNWQPVKPI